MTSPAASLTCCKHGLTWCKPYLLQGMGQGPASRAPNGSSLPALLRGQRPGWALDSAAQELLLQPHARCAAWCHGGGLCSGARRRLLGGCTSISPTPPLAVCPRGRGALGPCPAPPLATRSHSTGPDPLLGLPSHRTACWGVCWARASEAAEGTHSTLTKDLQNEAVPQPRSRAWVLGAAQRQQGCGRER